MFTLSELKLASINQATLRMSSCHMRNPWIWKALQGNTCIARLRTCAQDAFAAGASLPVQHSTAREMAAQAQQARTPKQLLLIPCTQDMCS